MSTDDTKPTALAALVQHEVGNAIIPAAEALKRLVAAGADPAHVETIRAAFARMWKLRDRAKDGTATPRAQIGGELAKFARRAAPPTEEEVMKRRHWWLFYVDRDSSHPVSLFVDERGVCIEWTEAPSEPVREIANHFDWAPIPTPDEIITFARHCEDAVDEVEAKLGAAVAERDALLRGAVDAVLAQRIENALVEVVCEMNEIPENTGIRLRVRRILDGGEPGSHEDMVVRAAARALGAIAKAAGTV